MTTLVPEKMKIWFPYIKTKSGGDVAIEGLAADYRSAGHLVILQPFPHILQYVPWILKLARCPEGADVVISTDWWGFAFRRPRVPLIVIIHGFMCDPVYRLGRSFFQGIFHETLIRYCYKKTIAAAERLVTVSNYTADVIEEIMGGERCSVIYNGIDTDFFCPEDKEAGGETPKGKTILFVGNLLRRKGAGLLPAIMTRLGPGYELRYTTGWRANTKMPENDTFTNLGLLNQEELRQEYRRADLLILPTWLESFALPVAEAMACGTPVVTSCCSALPELVVDGETGKLCKPGCPEDYADAIKELVGNPEMMRKMALQSRERISRYFNSEQCLAGYIHLVEDVVRGHIK